ncbi:hypothetical protein U1839_08190 [Sphingomonas sp. RT2P30]|uniref:hypothetical protein n=1 Tax=Parasphingomonas halimpatiens TaxID=3096162 RepID=UPI002FC82BD5
MMLIGATALAGCGLFGPSFPTYRYRLTVEVDTPAGLRTGSSVIEVRTTRNGPNALDSPNLIFVDVRGEAVAVDLPGGQILFATLSEWAGWVMLNANPYPKELDYRNKNVDADHVRYELMLANDALITLPRYFTPLSATGMQQSGYPMLVHFSDINDPKTVRIVDPENLSASFGKRFNLRRVTVQIVNDNITTGISNKLKWLRDYAEKHKRLNGSVSTSISTNEASDNLDAGSFSTEIEK